MKINAEEIIAALAAYRSPEDRPAGVFTVREGAAAANMGTRTFTEFLHKLKADGRLELAQIKVEGLNGRQTAVVGYKIKTTAKLKRA